MRVSSHLASRHLCAGIGFALISALIPACGSATTTPQGASVAGTWDLTTVNGVKPPFTLQAADPRQELLSKRYVITAAGTYTYAFAVRTTDVDGTVTTTNGSDAGTQTLTENLVTFRSNADGSTLLASVDGSSMTIVTGALTQLFTKQ